MTYRREDNMNNNKGGDNMSIWPDRTVHWKTLDQWLVKSVYELRDRAVRDLELRNVIVRFYRGLPFVSGYVLKTEVARGIYIVHINVEESIPIEEILISVSHEIRHIWQSQLDLEAFINPTREIVEEYETDAEEYAEEVFEEFITEKAIESLWEV